MDDRLLSDARQRFDGNTWVAAMLDAMRRIGESRERDRAMKEMACSSQKLRSRLAVAERSLDVSVSLAADAPAYLRRKPSQGKG